MIDGRIIPPFLQTAFNAACTNTSRMPPTDINEHLPLLFDLALKCDHVTELGTRGANGSTIAFLAAQPAEFIAWDLNPYAIVSQPIADLVVNSGRTLFQPRCGDSRKIILEPTDLLFIDTLHTAEQLKAELIRHADPLENKINKYIVFHDTVTFGKKGEDGTEPGLRSVIRWFQLHHAFPKWLLVEDRPNNNGLVVLEKVVPRADQVPPRG